MSCNFVALSDLKIFSVTLIRSSQDLDPLSGDFGVDLACLFRKCLLLVDGLFLLWRLLFISDHGNQRDCPVFLSTSNYTAQKE